MNMVCDSRQDTEKFLWLMKGRDDYTFQNEAIICTCTINPENKMLRPYFYNLSELGRAVSDCQELSGKYHVYLTMGYLGGIPDKGRGKMENVIGIPGVWAEVDFKRGDTHKNNKIPDTEEEAIQLLKTIIPSCPPTIMAHSGGGIYGFWLFEEPWMFQHDEDRETALNLNTSLYNMLRLKANENKWEVDNMSDLAHLLRLPGTANIKDLDDIRMAKIVESSDRFYTVEEMKNLLPNVLPEPKRRSPLVRKQRAIQNVPTTQNQEEYPPAYFDLIKSKCGFIEHCVEDAADLPEPEWYAALTIAARCEDGEALCHQISVEYPGYSEEETQLKIEHALNDTGPMTCAGIETNLTDEYCKTCPYKDKVTSPINLGTKTDFIDELNQEYAVVLVGGKCCILRETADPIFQRPDIKLMSFPDFHNWFGNRSVLYNKRFTTISKVWAESEKRRQYDGIIFEPKGDKKGYYNLWRGFTTVPRKGDCSLYLDHIRNVIAGGNDEIYEWILAFMARIIQDPGGQRPGTSIVMRGRQGTGKGVFVKYFAKIIGSHFLQINNQNQLTGHFNSHLKDALLVYCDEAIWGGDHQAEGVLKGMITEDTIMVEAKGKDSYPVKNHINIIVASNNEWCVPAGLEERRFMVLDVNDTARGDEEYFTKICDQMENGGCEALHYYLLNYDISKVNLRKIPRTKALLDQIMHSMSPFKKWWFAGLENGGFYREDGENEIEKFLPWDGPHEKQALYKTYTLTSKEINGKNHLSDSQFGIQLKEICPKISEKRGSVFNTLLNKKLRPWLYQLPSLEECRKDFEILVGMENTIPWPMENDTEEAQSGTTSSKSIQLQDNILDSIHL